MPGSIIKSFALTAFFPFKEILIFPVVAFVGTTVIMLLSVIAVITAAVPLKYRLSALVFPKPVPVIETMFPEAPLSGVMEIIVIGASVESLRHDVTLVANANTYNKKSRETFMFMEIAGLFDAPQQELIENKVNEYLIWFGLAPHSINS